MKNIHVLPTEKPSRLIWYTTEKYHLLKEPIFIDAPLKPSRHIYITSDEEIKEGDYVVQINFEKTNTQVIKCETEFQTKIANSKDGSFSKNKIILTTDQDLINDGVQEINDGFLEWFVKNPNCNFVRTIKVPYFDESSYSYVLIIPIEEDFELVSIGEEIIKLAIPMIQDRKEIKQETLEEAAERLYPTTINSFTDSGFDMSETERLIFINGAKWQQERMYSEEEVRQMFNRYNEVIAHRDNEEWQAWIDKQFKKK